MTALVVTDLCRGGHFSENSCTCWFCMEGRGVARAATRARQKERKQAVIAGLATRAQAATVTPGWETEARCRTEQQPTSFFFPAGKDATPTRLAAIAEYCSECPVKHDCRTAGRDEEGGWGGTVNYSRYTSQQNRRRARS